MKFSFFYIFRMLWAKLEEVDSTYVLLEDKKEKDNLALEIYTAEGRVNSLDDLYSLPNGECLEGFGSELY